MGGEGRRETGAGKDGKGGEHHTVLVQGIVSTERV